MRIQFRPSICRTDEYFYGLVEYFDLVTRLNPSRYIFFDNLYVYDRQSYSDNSRYDLNLCKVRFDRCYKDSTFIKERTNERLGGVVQVIELNLRFDMPFDFRLLSSDFYNYWKKDDYIEFVRPSFQNYTNENMGYYAFKSLATSFFAKMLDSIYVNDIFCFKRGNKIILAYDVDNKQTNDNLDDILDYFLDAIYEMVKCTSGRFNYPLPVEAGKKIINMNDWYVNKNRNRKFKKKKYVTYVD